MGIVTDKEIEIKCPECGYVLQRVCEAWRQNC